jgi:glycosyltransferase involved in cell wall biosynthesis
MTQPRTGSFQPLVSVVLTTRDRPRFLPLALAGYRQQRYPHRELIVVDDGEQFPVNRVEVAGAGGRLLRVPPGTALGSKLNAGIDIATGSLIQKMDDDDWYGPEFLATMVTGLARRWQVACRPTLLLLSPFLFFDLARWELRRSLRGHLPGATLLFGRDLWQEQPFRPLAGDEDVWFLLDQTRLGAEVAAVDALETYLAVRHAGLGADRDHTWTHQGSGAALDDYTRHLRLHRRPPEAILPEWALASYRALRAASEPGEVVPASSPP